MRAIPWLVLGLMLIAGGVGMAYNPDPRYADIPSYQEASGSAAAILIVMGVVMLLGAADTPDQRKPPWER